jgi:hypothetical protein
MELRESDGGVPPSISMVSPMIRQHKGTRCHCCAYCHPQGAGGGLRRCAHPDRAGLIVFGDQFVCVGYRPLRRDRQVA